MNEGYLVVEKCPKAILPSLNARYKGLYRTVPWSEEKYEEGWNDPLVFGRYTDPAIGLIGTLEAAREVLDRFAEILPRDDLEILRGEHEFQDYFSLSDPGRALRGSAQESIKQLAWI
jgi:hypothetical protein